MQFFTTLKRSIYNPSFYRELHEKPASFSIKFFALFLLIVTIVKSVIVGTSFFLALSHSGGLEHIEKTLADAYPNELVLNIQDGIVSSNVSEPYAIPMPEEWRDAFRDESSELPENIVVIKTREAISLQDFEQYETFVIIGRDTIGVYDPSNHEYRIEKISNDSNTFTLNKTTYTDFLGKSVDIITNIGIIALVSVLPILLFFGLAIGNAIYLIFGALIIWIVSRIQKRNISYSDAYRYGLHLIAVPIIYSAILTTLFPEIHVVFAGTILLAVMAYINMPKTITREDPPHPDTIKISEDTKTPSAETKDTNNA